MAIIPYLCVIQALSYSLNFYRNSENRGPQFTLIFHALWNVFALFPSHPLPFPSNMFPQETASLGLHLILLNFDLHGNLLIPLFVPLTHLTTQSLKPCQKTIHLKTGKKTKRAREWPMLLCLISIQIIFSVFLLFLPFQSV